MRAIPSIIAPSVLALALCAACDEVAAETPKLVSEREFLETYFGERWPEVAAQLPETALDPARTFDAAAIPPWEDVKAQLTLDSVTDDNDRKREIDSALEWSSGVFTDQVDFTAREYNPFGRKLSEADVARLRAIAKEHDAQLQLAGEQAAHAFAAAMTELWSAERYDCAPLINPPPRKHSGKLRCLRTFAIDNWNVVFAIYSGDFPEYDAARQVIRQLKLQRLSDVNEYIKQLPG